MSTIPHNPFDCPTCNQPLCNHGNCSPCKGCSICAAIIFWWILGLSLLLFVGGAAVVIWYSAIAAVKP